MTWVCADGKMIESHKPVLLASNRAFRYGDGIFETIRWTEGRARLELYHMERLFKGLSILGIDKDTLSEESVFSNIKRLTELNNCFSSARVRLSVYRQENNAAGYLLEAFAFQPPNEGRWKAGLYPFARKGMDALSNLKSANFLPYVMASRFAAEQGWDEAFVLNSDGRLADGSKTNVFLVHNNSLVTPALSEGCVGGVMRRHVIASLKGLREVKEQLVTQDDLEKAQEIFVTNALIGLQPLSHYNGRELDSETAQSVIQLVRF